MRVAVSAQRTGMLTPPPGAHGWLVIAPLAGGVVAAVAWLGLGELTCVLSECDPKDLHVQRWITPYFGLVAVAFGLVVCGAGALAGRRDTRRAASTRTAILITLLVPPALPLYGLAHSLLAAG